MEPPTNSRVGSPNPRGFLAITGQRPIPHDTCAEKCFFFQRGCCRIRDGVPRHDHMATKRLAFLDRRTYSSPKRMFRVCRGVVRNGPDQPLTEWDDTRKRKKEKNRKERKISGFGHVMGPQPRSIATYRSNRGSSVITITMIVAHRCIEVHQATLPSPKPAT